MNLLKRFSFLPSLGALWLLLSTAAFAGVVETTFYHNDLSGSPVAATDDDGHLKWREEYRPYGERILKQAAAGDNSRWYTSHPHDEEIQLTYMGARFYDPVIGRFMGTDPVGFHENNLVSFNRYAYASNNPYSYYDPNGKSVYSTALRFVIKGGDVAATFAGVVEDTNTLLDSNASTGDRVIAFLSLASEVLPVSGRDVLDASNAVKSITKKSDATDGLGDFTHNYQRSIGASQRIPKVLQTGGNTLNKRSAKALNDQLRENLNRREWGRALEKLKEDLDLPGDHHARIMDNGDYIDDAGNILGNLLDYVP